MTQPELTSEQQAALRENNGFVQGSAYVLISKHKYREMMGVGSDDELAESLRAIDAAINDMKAGRTIPLDEAKRQFDGKYGIHD